MASSSGLKVMGVTMAHVEIPIGAPNNTSYHNQAPEIGHRLHYLELGVRLHEAAFNGDWETAERIFEKEPDYVCTAIDVHMDTALHAAMTAPETDRTLSFVKKLVNRMEITDLVLQNSCSNTAFWMACQSGKLNSAKIMLEKNSDLLHIYGSAAVLPVTAAVYSGRYDTAKHLLYNHQMRWTDDEKRETVRCCVDCGFFDLALHILGNHVEISEVKCLLLSLARRREAFDESEKKLITSIMDPIYRIFPMKVKPVAEETVALKLLRKIWRHATINMSYPELEQMIVGPTEHSSGILFLAAEKGNKMFIVELLRTYPRLALCCNEDGLSIFQMAIIHRHQGVYQLWHEVGSALYDLCEILDKDGNNWLHLVGKTSKKMANKTPGASLLLQRELLWFQEVKRMMPPSMWEQENKDGLTPLELFSKENENIVSTGFDWMRDCMVIDALIIASVFSVAFAIPGGHNQVTGIPILIQENGFLIFLIADALSLFTASTSLLVFLSILFSRHDQREFLYKLPMKLMMGLICLFISLAAMMVTFAASFYVLYHKGLRWVPLVTSAFAFAPVMIFAILQLPLLIDMLCSMFDPHYLLNPKRRIIWSRNPR